MLSNETEMTIIASAEKLFYRKGKAGTSMQEIAADAGINRTLLNYYFRTKDQLFEAVFRTAMGRFVPELAALLHSGLSIREFITAFIDKVIDNMIRYPQIPGFVLQELSSNPDRMPKMMTEMGVDPFIFMEKLAAEPDYLLPEGMDPRQFIMHVISLCIFPFAARPVMTALLYQGDEDAYLSAMEERRQLIPALVAQFLKEKPKS